MSQSEAVTKFYNPYGRYGEPSKASKFASPTPGVNLTNLYHAGRCPGSCCWERKGASVIGLGNNSSTEMWDTIQHNNQTASQDELFHRGQKIRKELQQHHEEQPTPCFTSLRAKSFSTSDLYPKLANQRHTLSNTLVTYEHLPWEMKDPAVVKDGHRQKFKPAGHTTTMHGKSKRIGFSAVSYNILAAPNAPPRSDATPRQMEKTNFMSEAHKSPPWVRG